MPKAKIYNDNRTVISIRESTKKKLMKKYPTEKTPGKKLKRLLEDDGQLQEKNVSRD